MMKKTLSTTIALLQKQTPAIKDYYQLTKPGIIFGNLLSALGGFYLASESQVNTVQLIWILIGIGLVVGSGCVVNNYYDRDIDSLMERTKNRPLIITPRPLKSICWFTIALGLSGLYLILIYGNALAGLLAIFGWLVYVFLYTVWLKRTSPVSTLVGSLSGAAPPVIAYCAVRGSWDLGASLLFVLFTLWQMPHHYAIGIYRADDYSKAKIPILPSQVGINKTIKIIRAYILAFITTSLLIYIAFELSVTFLLMTISINTLWLYTTYQKKTATQKAKSIFIYSILVVSVHCVAMIIG